MNKHLQTIANIIQKPDALTEQEKEFIRNAIREANKELSITEFKLERTEKVKRTTAILLEETIEELEQKRKAVEESRTELQQSLEDLKAAQEQLIQQEKLASLGQLTAGIAHEIKNPLNFVNNFSEVSVELIEEVREELSVISGQLSATSPPKSPFALPSKATRVGGEGGENGKAIQQEDDWGLILDILNDIEANLRKIHEHGSRADSIVKSMLQHSRGGDGKMEPADLNKLVKEYVNLTFHGMRAGKNPMSVDIEFDLDKTIEKVPLIAEDFSRVIVNLCNNAFDAMREKLSASGDQLSAYRPKLVARTFRESDQIIVEIEDNGPGIREEIRAKIMQPFFTTKKGTEGTGLGLSITHDIIKAHGGEMNVATKPGEGSRFIISIPDNKKS